MPADAAVAAALEAIIAGLPEPGPTPRRPLPPAPPVPSPPRVVLMGFMVAPRVQHGPPPRVAPPYVVRRYAVPFSLPAQVFAGRSR